MMEPQDINALLLAALLHDIGHYPFAHSLEEISNKFDHVGYSKRIILGELDQYLLKKMPARRTIRDVIEEEWQVSPREVVAIIDRHAPSRMHRVKRELLLGILHGPLGVDRLDYLERDAHHCGVPYGAPADKARLLESLTARRTCRAWD